MFYYASKGLWFLATPSNLLLALVLVGLAGLGTRRLARAGFRVASFGALGLLAAGLGPVGNWLIVPLEERFPIHREDGRAVDGIIVLGGAVQPDESMGRGQLTVNEAGERILALADLGRRYPGAKIVFTGGSGAMLVEEPAEAAVIERFVETIGVPRGRVVFEDRSRTTYENAAFTRNMVQPGAGERWLLVTSAWHMPRSIGCFRQAGFPVIAYPVDFRTRGPGDLWRGFGFVADGLRRLDIAAKEWVGLVFYRLSGRTDAVFPGPERG